MKLSRIIKITKGGLLILLAVCLSNCSKFLPDLVDTLNNDVTYTTTSISPVLGRNTLYKNTVNVGVSSNLPLDFELVNVRTVVGSAAPELTSKFPVKVWNQAYTSSEKSIEEIEAKRSIEYRPIFEIQKNSGEFMMWNPGKSSFIKTQPDEGYIFDVKISNSGGLKYARNLKLNPLKERLYEPSPYNAITGVATQPFVSPSVASNIYGDRTGNPMGSNGVEVYFFKDETRTGNSLSFTFLDSLNRYIDPNKFNETDWPNVVHGFNMVKTDKKVTYEVAYPIPLVENKSKYTNSSGTRATTKFRYSRIGFNGFRELATIGIDFAIYEEGHWEIQFRFRKESPKFVNE